MDSLAGLTTFDIAGIAAAVALWVGYVLGWINRGREDQGRR